MASKAKDEREARNRSRVYQARAQVNAHKEKRRSRDNLIAGVAAVAVVALAVGAQLAFFGFGPGKTPEPASTPAITQPPTTEPQTSTE